MKSNKLSQRKTKGVFQFILLISALITVIFSIKNPQILQKRASVSDAPHNVMIANTTDRSFTVLWTTNVSATGSITYTVPNGKPITAFDIRDTKNKKQGKYKTHMVQVKKLKPNATYAFYISSNGTQYGNGTIAYTVQTAKRIKKMNPSHVIELPLPDFNKKTDELIVAFTAKNNSGESNTLATLVQDKKVFMDLGNFRTKDVQQLFRINRDTTLSVFLIGDNQNFGYDTAISAKINELSPVYLHGTSQETLKNKTQRKKNSKK